MVVHYLLAREEERELLCRWIEVVVQSELFEEHEFATLGDEFEEIE